MKANATHRPTVQFEPFPRAALEDSITNRFEEMVRQFPEKIACSSTRHCWSYARLDAAANDIAGRIRTAKIAPKTPILLNMQNDAPAIAAIIAILKAGNFYCALDAGLPRPKLDMIVKTLRPALLLCDQTNFDLSAELAGTTIPLLNIEAAAAVSHPDNDPTVVSPDDLAYVFFTSGSTGEPKGVMDSHRNVLHNIMRYTNNLRIDREDRLSLLQSLSFSGSVSSLFCALLNGATACPFDILHDGTMGLRDWIVEQELTVFHAVPALFRLIVSDGQRFTKLRIIRLEGDQASPADAALFQRHFAHFCVLVNGLGATECGIVRQYFLSNTSPIPKHGLPIGYAIEDMAVSVIDEDGQDVATGTIGEITAKSRYLALGYWDRPDLTAQAFLPDSDDPQSRIYRTGDLGRLDHAGCLEYLGRKDSRAKLNGQWVDLAAVEAKLTRFDEVKEAVAVIQRDSHGEAQVIVYYTAVNDRRLYLDEVRRELSIELAGHCLPAKLERLDHLPLNANGKIDRLALPPPSHDRPAVRTDYVSAQNLLQQQVSLIWQNLLAVRPVGIHDDFFDLGGNSLIAARLISELQTEFGTSIALQQLLTHSTVAAVAALLQDQASAMTAPIIELRRGHPGAVPFYFLHGDYLSGGLYCVNLARHFNAEQPFYVLPPCGTNGGPILPSFAAMAKRHIEILRAQQPVGPYFLGGTCNGGLVAYEMARQLVAQGEQIKALVLIHATAANLRYRELKKLVAPLGIISRRAELDWYVRLQPFWHRLNQLPAWSRMPFVLGKIPALLQRVRAKIAKRLVERIGEANNLASDSLVTVEQDSSIREIYLRIESEHIPGLFAGRVFLLWADGDIESSTDALHWWRQIAPRSELIKIPGSPHSVSLTAHAPTVAKIICSCVAR